MLGATQILAALPASLSSAVLFHLEPLRQVADDDLLRRMFGLPAGIDPGEDSHVVLTPLGPLLATPARGRIRFAQGGALPIARGQDCLLTRYAEPLALLPGEEPDCLGVGQVPGLEPVGLHIRIDGLQANGVAALRAKPPREGMDLLRAVGVEYLGGAEVPGGYLARFRNRLDQHLLAGALSGFTRTDHCNLFFMRHATIGPDLRHGLLEAARGRIARAVAWTTRAVEQLAEAAVAGPLALTCVPPPPARPGPYGDIVPLGFLLSALEEGPSADLVRRRLEGAARDHLWSFHTGGLPTATDTALAAQALADHRIAERLEGFATAEGAYLPQLSGTAPGRMRADVRTTHWCQPDFATTCLALALRQRLGLHSRRTLAWLADRFDVRSGLFLANPFLTDWALARALAGAGDEPPVPGLRARLRAELLAAQDPDGSFGTFDPCLSTSAAILALAELGECGRPVLLAQLRLLDWVPVRGPVPGGTPFFSSLRCDLPAHEDLAEHLQLVNGEVHELTWYRDDHSLIATALACSALRAPVATDADAASQRAPASACHPRYRCGDLQHYVREFVLEAMTRPAAGPSGEGDAA